jgi:hypothetical protein
MDNSILFGSMIGRAKRSQLEKEEKQVERSVSSGTYYESPTKKEDRVRRKKDLYSIKELADSLPPGESPNFYWERLVRTLQNLGRQEETIEVGKYYTFKYWAKTEGKYFDLYPVSFIISKSAFYVLGINYHWKNAPQYVESMYRRYDYSQFYTRGYEIKEWELEDVLRIATFYPIKR